MNNVRGEEQRVFYTDKDAVMTATQDNVTIGFISELEFLPQRAPMPIYSLGSPSPRFWAGRSLGGTIRFQLITPIATITKRTSPEYSNIPYGGHHFNISVISVREEMETIFHLEDCHLICLDEDDIEPHRDYHFVTNLTVRTERLLK